MLIVIEGIDGSGKATQTQRLVEHLRREHYPVETMGFPRYQENFFGRLVRRYLDGAFGPAAAVNPYLASTLYAFDRWESSSQIRHWLDSGRVVVLDRYVESNLIHQAIKVVGTARQDFIPWLLSMEYEVLKLPKPNLTIFLHLPVRVANDLMEQRGRTLDGHERQREHLEAAERICLELAQQRQWSAIECTERGKLLTPEAIHQKVWNVVRKIFSARPRGTKGRQANGLQHELKK